MKNKASEYQRSSVFLCLLVLSLFSLVLSCKSKRPKVSNTISRDEVNQLMMVDRTRNDLVTRLNEHFKDEGYTFTLAYEGFDRDNGHDIKPLLKRPTLLQCDGTTDEDSASRADEEIRRILTAEELDGLNIQYEVEVEGFGSAKVVMPAALLNKRKEVKPDMATPRKPSD